MLIRLLGATLLGLLLWGGAANAQVQGGCDQTVPPQASARGLTRPIVVVCDFSQAGIIDTAATGHAGFVLYPFQPCPFPALTSWNGGPGHNAWPCTTSSDWSISGAALIIDNATGGATKFHTLSMIGQTGSDPPPGYVGGLHAPVYIVVKATAIPCVQCGAGQNWAVWMQIAEQQAYLNYPGRLDSTELDICDQLTITSGHNDGCVDIAMFAWRNEGVNDASGALLNSSQWAFSPGAGPTGPYWGAAILDAKTYGVGGTLGAIQVFNGATRDGVVQQGTSGVGSDGNNIQLTAANFYDKLATQTPYLILQPGGNAAMKVEYIGIFTSPAAQVPFSGVAP